MARQQVAPGVVTSPIYRIKGMKSRWEYPNEKAQPENCKSLVNMNLSESGTAESRNGYTTWNSSVLAGSEPVTGLREQTFANLTTKHLVCVRDRIYTSTTAAHTNVTGTLSLSEATADDRTRFTFIRNQVVGTNGKDETWVYSGSGNATALSGMPWTTCEDVISHRGVLLALGPTESGTRYPTRVRWSGINTSTFIPDITSWPDANRYEIYEGTGAIIGAVDNFGMALIFKEDGLYPASVEYDVGFLELRLKNPIRGFSPIAKHSIVSRPEFVFGVAKEGAFVFDPGLGFRIITLDIQDEWELLNRNRLKYAQSYVREKDHQVRTLLSGAGNASGYDKVLVWDWETGDVWFDEPTDVMGYGSTIDIAGTEYDWLGSNNGFVYQSNVGNDDNGTGYSWAVNMQPNDLGAPGKSKKIINFRTLYRSRQGQQGATLQVIRDRGQFPARSKSITFSTSTWDDTETWDINSSFNSEGSLSDRFFVNRIAETISPTWTGNQPITLDGYQVEYKIIE